MFSLSVALSLRVNYVETLVRQPLTHLLFPMDKSNLSPLRALHFLALAVLAARFAPRTWRWLATPVMRAAICCGHNSLPIFCLGVLLALASQVALIEISDGLPMQIALSLGGILMMIVAAMLLDAIGIKPRRQPAHEDPAGTTNGWNERAYRPPSEAIIQRCISPEAR